MSRNSSKLLPQMKTGRNVFGGVACRSATLAILALVAGVSVVAQDAPPGDGKTVGGYLVHQTVDLGGHVVQQAGNESVYDTLVNIQSGPRILDYFLEMRGIDPKRNLLFDHLFTTNFGYGGDPNNVSLLNLSKGRIYDFHGTFRRDRQYFDYNLLANPLIPPESDPFVPILHSPHLFNTVRQLTDLNLRFAPLSMMSGRLGYSHYINQGPSYSTVDEGAEALLLQNWRNSTDSYTLGIDWKPVAKTIFSFDEFIAHHKGDTNWQIAGLNYVLSNGTPVSAGVDLSNIWKTPCAAPFNADGTFSATCNAFLGYSRYAPTRATVWTEQVRFQSATIKNLTMNGRYLYSDSSSTLNNYNEFFNGLVSKSAVRQSVTTGLASIERVNANADFGLTWQATQKIAVSDLFNFWYWRIPGTNSFTETDYAGTSMLQPPGATTTTTTPDYQFLNQKTTANLISVSWAADPRAQFSLGYRYRSRTITESGGNAIPIHENWGIFGAVLQPTPQWRINFNVDAMYADNAFTRISPRQIQQYLVRSTYRPHTWLTFSGTVSIFETRDNVETVNYLAHNRDFSFSTTISPSEHWGFDLNYAYTSVYSSVLECYAATPALPTAGTAPPVCASAGTPFLSNGYYNAPTQFGSAGFVLTPVKRVHANAGYRMSSVNGTTDFVNIRQVNGSLQSGYQSPYLNLAYDLDSKWTWKADYNYHGFGEGTEVGPTLPRSFHANIYTFSVRYAF